MRPRAENSASTACTPTKLRQRRQATLALCSSRPAGAPGAAGCDGATGLTAGCGPQALVKGRSGARQPEDATLTTLRPRLRPSGPWKGSTEADLSPVATLATLRPLLQPWPRIRRGQASQSASHLASGRRLIRVRPGRAESTPETPETFRVINLGN